MRIMHSALPSFLSLIAPLPYSPPYELSKDFIRIPAVNHGSTHRAVGIVLPGWGIDPSNYIGVTDKVQNLMYDQDVAIDMYIAKYTWNMGHRFETKDRIKKIMAELRSEKPPVFLIGHSMGAFSSIDASIHPRIEGLVLWGGHFNSNGAFPYDQLKIENFSKPFLNLLCENDSRFSCSEAIKDLPDVIRQFRPSDPSRIVITIPEFDHLSGISGDKLDHASDTIAAHISNYLTYLTTYSSTARDKLAMDFAAVMIKYSPFLYERSTQSSVVWLKVLQRAFSKSSSDVSISCTAHPSATKFIKSHGTLNKTSIQIHSYTPPKFRITALTTNKLTEPAAWVKFKSTKESATISARQLNIKTFQDVYKQLSKSERLEYDRSGRKMIFEDDISVALVPACSIIWLSIPLQLVYDATSVTVYSPVLRTPIGTGTYDSCFNAKLISKAQVLEWILFKSHMKA